MGESSNRMDDLAQRAQQARERVHASANETKENLEAQVAGARASTDEKSRELQAQAAGARDEAAQRWDGVRQSWNDHVAEMRRKAAADKAGFDHRRAEHRAKLVEEDALAAVEFAILAVEEAEYEVLDALLARAEADDLAAAKA